MEVVDATKKRRRKRPAYYKHPALAQCVAAGLIGNCGTLHEIFVHTARHGGRTTAYYYANCERVSAEVYAQSLATANLDQYCPACAAGTCGHGGGEDEDIDMVEAIPLNFGTQRGQA